MITIITAVYNTQEYLHTCIDSILAQTCKDWELLLIDDGSTDNSGKICDEYARRDPRVKVIHKQNGGIASVRQTGTQMARGEYSIHVDSDDWIEPEMLADMLATAQKEDADIVVADYYNDKGKLSTRFTQSRETNPEEAIGAILKGRQLGALWNKLIRHDLYGKYGITFANGVNLGEDTLVLASLYRHPLKIVYSDKAHYHYVNHMTATLSRVYDKKKHADINTYLDHLAKTVSPRHMPKVDRIRRMNELRAMSMGIAGIAEQRGKGVSLRTGEIFARGIDTRCRLIALLYILRADKLCEKLIKR